MNTSQLRHCLAACVLLAAPLVSHGAPDGDAIVIGRQYEIQSQVLHEKRTYYVHKPARYDASRDSFPLIVVLDGETHFQHTSTSVDFLASNGRIPDMIVVGVANTDRDRDLTPPLTTPAEPGRVPEGTIGGAQHFLAFIADELIPALERKYRTRRYRILIGHSYGGLFATYALLNRPEVFNAYIAISPSLGWDHEALVKSAEQFVAAHKDLRASWYMTIGNERGGMPGGAASKFIGILQASPMRWLHSDFQRWPEETHGSVPLRSIYDGLQFLFDDWYVQNPFALYEQSGLAGLEKRYASMSERLGYTVKVPEFSLLGIARTLEERQRSDEQRSVLEKTVELYPNSEETRSALAQLKIDPAAVVPDRTKAK